MKITFITVMLFFLIPLSAFSGELNLVFRHGEPIKDRAAAWDKHIDFASWIDEELIVYSTRGNLICLSTKSGDAKWEKTINGEVSDWSVSRTTNRLAILISDKTTLAVEMTMVIDCQEGENDIFRKSR